MFLAVTSSRCSGTGYWQPGSPPLLTTAVVHHARKDLIQSFRWHRKAWFMIRAIS